MAGAPRWRTAPGTSLCVLRGQESSRVWCSGQQEKLSGGGCRRRGGGMLEANKELVRRHFEEIWNQQNLGVADELMADDYVEHAVAPFGQAEPGRGNGPAAMRGPAAWRGGPAHAMRLP